MSGENVEIARRAFDALNRGDLSDAMKDTATDFAFQTRTSWLRSFRDRRIVRITFFQDRREALEAAEGSE